MSTSLCAICSHCLSVRPPIRAGPDQTVPSVCHVCSSFICCVILVQLSSILVQSSASSVSVMPPPPGTGDWYNYEWEQWAYAKEAAEKAAEAPLSWTDGGSNNLGAFEERLEALETRFNSTCGFYKDKFEEQERVHHELNSLSDERLKQLEQINLQELQQKYEDLLEAQEEHHGELQQKYEDLLKAHAEMETDFLMPRNNVC